eukprot:CAMPEP_0177268820 /NCGR_PEP_ID=MMETSP0367-20130122/64014_1 /TAXON_ID=447022 ORGANISM="Scrippsiella hangoei-like, Strain SHHI-4" /NCGR_SAMPLE_ID=MMETSP0367 /ASSEMBLY_ACC=CAM_ASM_000362 /LENGTH=46 /DNA_ID= /DNA_START= /DNA_END= /DNA_ORIENTATION=
MSHAKRAGALWSQMYSTQRRAHLQCGSSARNGLSTLRSSKPPVSRS